LRKKNLILLRTLSAEASEEWWKGKGEERLGNENEG